MSKRPFYRSGALLALLVGLILVAPPSWRGFGRPANSAPIDPALYGALKWRLIGPFRAGRSIAAAGVAGELDTYYFGGVGGGVWKTTNSGRTWEPIFDSEPISSIGAIAVAPSNPNVI